MFGNPYTQMKRKSCQRQYLCHLRVAALRKRVLHSMEENAISLQVSLDKVAVLLLWCILYQRAIPSDCTDAFRMTAKVVANLQVM